MTTSDEIPNAVLCYFIQTYFIKGKLTDPNLSCYIYLFFVSFLNVKFLLSVKVFKLIKAQHLAKVTSMTFLTLWLRVFVRLCIFIFVGHFNCCWRRGVYLSNIYNSGITRSSSYYYAGIYPPPEIQKPADLCFF